MDIDSQAELTPEEIQELEYLKRIIEAAVSDGQLSATEMERIKSAVWADGKITFAELELYRTLVLEKIERGELRRTD